MAKEKDLSPVELGAAVCDFLLITNYVTATYLDYPVLYCLMTPILAKGYEILGPFVLVVTLILAAYHIFVQNHLKALMWVAIVIGIVEFPRAVEYTLRLGGSCG